MYCMYLYHSVIFPVTSHDSVPHCQNSGRVVGNCLLHGGTRGSTTSGMVIPSYLACSVPTSISQVLPHYRVTAPVCGVPELTPVSRCSASTARPCDSARAPRPTQAHGIVRDGTGPLRESCIVHRVPQPIGCLGVAPENPRATNRNWPRPNQAKPAFFVAQILGTRVLHSCAGPHQRSPCPHSNSHSSRLGD